MKITIKKGRLLVIISLIGISLIGGYKGAQLLWGDHFVPFFIGILKNPFQVGAFAPCSVFVVKEITKYVAHHISNSDKKPLHVLEVGAGSGVFTQGLEKIMSQFPGEYQLDVIEIDPFYYKVLQEQFADKQNVHLYCMDVAQWQPDYKYDFIISSIPFTNLDNELISTILERYKKIIKPNGIISYIEHMWFPKLKSHFIKGQEKEEYLEKLANLTNFRKEFGIKKSKVWLNIMPVYVYHLQIS